MSDSLHSLLGFSDGALAAYVTTLCMKERRSAARMQALLAEQLDLSPAQLAAFCTAFITRLQASAPAAAPKPSKPKPKEDVEEGSYALVSDQAPKAKTREKTKVKGEKLSKEERRERDRKERDALAERLREKDRQATKKLGGDAREERVDELDLERARVISRRSYLTKREEQQLEILRRSIKEEERMFASENLSKEERARLLLDKEILRLAESRKNAEQPVDAYEMPEDYVRADGVVDQQKRMDVLQKRYVEQAAPVSEQEMWEQLHIGRATLKFGSKQQDVDKQYEFVVPDQIDFIKEELMAGHDVEAAIKEQEQEAVLPTKQSRAEELQKVRQSLPIYPYREQILKAVDEHQVRRTLFTFMV